METDRANLHVTVTEQPRTWSELINATMSFGYEGEKLVIRDRNRMNGYAAFGIALQYARPNAVLTKSAAGR
jgi:hypothetical protein